MCGIGAIVRKKDYGLSASVVGEFNAAIAHRGPDGEGVRFFPDTADAWRVALAHRRLSIIDLTETGAQPMSYALDNYWITFNGEIYNYIEIRKQLQTLGYVFRGTSDTETILAAYVEWGTAAFEKLRGMWAFILYDAQKEKVIACRDRLGIKPLYYYRHSGYTAFGSEPKQFLRLSEFEARADRSVIHQYLQTGFETTDRTFFENIKPVAPGTFVELDAGSLAITAPVSFWEPTSIRPSVYDVHAASTDFGQMFDESVSIHLRSDVPVGCQLSGGLDSSAVFALMQEESNRTSVHSFTIQFPGFAKDETPFVKIMLNGSNAMPHFTTPTPESFQSDLAAFVWNHDEPVGSFAHYAGYALARLIATQKIKVVLNGQGGDEILGGYWQQYYSYLYSLARRGSAGALFGQMAGTLSRGGNPELIKQMPAMLARYKSRSRRQSLKLKQGFEESELLFSFKNYFAMSPAERRVYDIRFLILPRLLKWDDRNLMAFGVEGRYPFLDHKLIETALSFDPSVLFRKGWTKYPLRMAMKDKIPREIYFRKSKWGFETPQQDWLMNALRPMLMDWLAADKPLHEVVEKESVNTLAEGYWKSGDLEDGQQLFRLFMLDQWLRIFPIRL